MNNDIKGTCVMVGYGFDDESPYLLFDSINNISRVRFKLHILNRNLTIVKHGKKKCIGRFDLKTFNSTMCPHNADIYGNKNTCDACARYNAFNPAFYNLPSDKLSPKQKEYNENPHYVYIACFGKDVFKVGICHINRTRTRLMEQGARGAVIVYMGSNAYDARNIEKKIKDEFNIPESISSKQKIQLLINSTLLKTDLMTLNNVGKIIATQIGFDNYRENIFEFDKNYLSGNKLSPNIFSINNENSTAISGKVVGMIGDLLIVEQSGLQFVASTKKYISHIVTITDDIIKNKEENQQMRLF